MNASSMFFIRMLTVFLDLHRKMDRKQNDLEDLGEALWRNQHNRECECFNQNFILQKMEIHD